MSTIARPSEKAHSSGRLLFREANDRVRELFDDTDVDVRLFFCECRDAFCTDAVRMTVAEYDAVCAAGTYAVIPGHEDLRDEVVVGRSETYAIVRAAGA